MRPSYYDYYRISDNEAADLYEELCSSPIGIYCDGLLNPIGFSLRFATTEVYSKVAEIGELGIDAKELNIILEFDHWHEHDAPLNKFYRGPFARGELDLDSITEDLLDVMCIKNLEPSSFLPVVITFYGINRFSGLVEVPPSEATHLLFHHQKPAHERNLFSEVASFDCGDAGWFTLHEFGGIVAECPYSCVFASETVVRKKLLEAEAAFQRKVISTNPSTAALRLAGYLEHGLIGLEMFGVAECE